MTAFELLSNELDENCHPFRDLSIFTRDNALPHPQTLSSHPLPHTPQIKFVTNTVVAEAKGSTRLEELVLRNVVTGTTVSVPAAGLFFAIGHEPATAFLQGQVALDEDGYIVTKPGTSKTSVAGVFAAGDVQDKHYRQAITAAGSGCMAALDAEHFIAETRQAAL